MNFEPLTKEFDLSLLFYFLETHRAVRTKFTQGNRIVVVHRVHPRGGANPREIVHVNSLKMNSQDRRKEQRSYSVGGKASPWKVTK